LGLERSESRSQIRREVRILEREVKRLERADLIPLEKRLRDAERKTLRACMDSGGYRESCRLEWQSSSEQQALSTKVAAIREEIERLEARIRGRMSAKEVRDDSSSSLHRMAIESDLEWFEEVRTRQAEVESKGPDELKSLCRSIEQSGCQLSCGNSEKISVLESSAYGR
jgi:hypothetical protein